MLNLYEIVVKPKKFIEDEEEFEEVMVMIEVNSGELSDVFGRRDKIKIKKLLNENVSIDTIMKAFEISKEEIEKIKNNDSTYNS